MSQSPPQTLTTLTTPVAVWHESRVSARTDLLTSLSTSAAFIRTDRPLAPGTPVYLDLDVDNGGACVDAIAASVDVGGFSVDFLTVDDRARLIIEARLGAELPASGPRSGLVEQPAIALSRTATSTRTAGVFAAPPVAAMGRSETPTAPAAGLYPRDLGALLPSGLSVDDDDAPPPPSVAPVVDVAAAATVVDNDAAGARVAAPAPAPASMMSSMTPASFAAPPTSVGPEPDLVMHRTRTDELFAVDPTPKTTPKTPVPAPPRPLSRTRTAPLGMPAFQAPDAPMPDVPTTPAFGQQVEPEIPMAPTPAPRFFEGAPVAVPRAPTPPPSPRTTQELILTSIDLTIPPAPEPTPAPRLTAPDHPTTLELLPLQVSSTPAPDHPTTLELLPLQVSTPPTTTTPTPTPAPDHPATLELLPLQVSSTPTPTPAPLPLQVSSTPTPPPTPPPPKDPSGSTQPWSRALAANLPLDDAPAVENTQRWPTAVVRSDLPQLPIALPAQTEQTSLSAPKTPPGSTSTPPTSTQVVTQPFAMTPVPLREVPLPQQQLTTAPQFTLPTTPVPLPTPAPNAALSLGADLGLPPPRATTPPPPRDVTAPWPVARVKQAPAEAELAEAVPVATGAPPSSMDAVMDVVVSGGFEITFDEAFDDADDADGAPVASVTSMIAPPATTLPKRTAGPGALDFDAAFEVEFTAPRQVAPAAALRPLPQPEDDDEGGDVEMVDVDFSEFKDVIGASTFRSEGPPPPAVSLGKEPLRTSTRPPTPPAGVPGVGPAIGRGPPLVRASTAAADPMSRASAVSPPLGGNANSQKNPFAGESQPPLAAASVPPMFAPRDPARGPDNWTVTQPSPPPRSSTPPSSLPAPRLLDEGFNAMLKTGGTNSSTPRPGAFPSQETPAPAPAPMPTAAPSPFAALPVAPMVTNPGDDDLPIVGGAAAEEDDDLPVVGGIVEGVEEDGEDWSFGPPTSPGRRRPTDALPSLTADPLLPRKD